MLRRISFNKNLQIDSQSGITLIMITVVTKLFEICITYSFSCVLDLNLFSNQNTFTNLIKFSNIFILISNKQPAFFNSCIIETSVIKFC